MKFVGNSIWYSPYGWNPCRNGITSLDPDSNTNCDDGLRRRKRYDEQVTGGMRHARSGPSPGEFRYYYKCRVGSNPARSAISGTAFRGSPCPFRFHILRKKYQPRHQIQVPRLCFVLSGRSIPVPERRVACKVLQQDRPGSFVLVADEAQPEQETAESVFVVVRVGGCGHHTLLPPGHIAQFGDEFGVGFDLVRVLGKGEPGKTDLRIRYLNGQAFGEKGPFEERFPPSHDLPQNSKLGIVQCGPQHGNGQPVRRFLRHTLVAVLRKVGQQRLGCVAVHRVRDDQGAATVQQAVADLVTHGRRSKVARDGVEGCAHVLCQPFPGLACHIVGDGHFHAMYLLRFGRYIYHSEWFKLQVVSVRKGDKDAEDDLYRLFAILPSEQERH